MLNFKNSAKQLKKATRPEDIFINPADIEITYKSYAKLVHPDLHANSAESVELFKILGELYSAVQEKIKSGTYGNLGTISKKGGSTYTLQTLFSEDALANTYTSDSGILKVYRSPANKNFAVAEVNALKEIHQSPVKKLEVIKHLPVLVDNFQLDTKQHVNVFQDYGAGYTLEQVRNKHKNLELKHAAWMFNRILGSLLAVHQAGFVNNSITPDSFLIYPESHNGLLTNFAYSGKVGVKLTGYNPKWKGFYAPEVLEKYEASFGSDIYMAANCLIYLIGADIPKPIQNFYKYCTLGMKQRPQDVFELHDDFQAILKNIFGNPKFHEFSMEN